ncbi:MAG TPA: DUF1579 family protein [Longimicrobium sp.]|nr:DUF1579 family protein [Longimicrobium sp.]
MSAFDDLIACAGRWTGTNALHYPPNEAPDVTASTLEVTPVVRGRFARVDYTWSYQGAPHEGTFVIGFDAKAGTANSYWVDSWHMAPGGLTSAGVDGGALVVLGSYPAPPGPDWGWRIAIEPRPGSSLRIAMTNISPEGEEYPAVEATYSPA